MPRYRHIRAPEAIQRRIRDDTHDITKTAKIPVWNGEWNVDCNEIVLPLEYLFFRINNARTTDSQIALLNSSREMPHPLTGDILPNASDDCFTLDSQYEQETQDLQGALLCIEADRKRENGKNLFEELRENGWLEIEVPIITRQGVLINGNSRVAALEAMLRNGEAIDRIDTAAPQIKVRVVPNDGAGEPDIEKLENFLQKPDGVRLNYNWIQDTSKINRRLRIESIERIHTDYKDLERFKTIAKMEKTLRSRDLVDELYEMIDLPHQAIFEKPNEHMIYSMQDQIDKDYIKSNLSNLSKAKALFAYMLQVTQEGEPIGEMRYHVTRIKSEDDVTTFCERIEDAIPDSFTSSTIEDQFGRPQEVWGHNNNSFIDATPEDQEMVAENISRAADEMKRRNSGEDNEAAIIKRIKESIGKVKQSKELYVDMDGYPRQVELQTKLVELGREIRDYLSSME